jgi:hypothetical protein
MRGKSITRYGIILISAFATLSVYAQQQETPKQPQDFSTAFSGAHAACMALWADHAFDPIRDKFPFGGEKPTFAMLTDPTRILAKDTRTQRCSSVKAKRTPTVLPRLILSRPLSRTANGPTNVPSYSPDVIS